MKRPIVVAAFSACLVACGESPAPTTDAPAPAPEATSLLGEPLYAHVDTTGEVARADSALALLPDDLELIIAAGRVRRNHWQYRDEMALYDRAIGLAPDDWRAYRYRGHRRISVREFPAAIQDLERARELAPLNWDVSYHLGLAYYVSGRFADAADEYLRCLALAGDAAAKAADSADFRSCSRNGNDPESLVAMTEWAARALLRSGRAAEADALAAAVPTDLEVSENLSYYHNLLYQKGLKTADELLVLGPDAPYRLETVGFGVATRLLVAGDTARAMEVFDLIAADPWWPGFGRIAAEAELARAR
jgi:tetratricopeptide (TPR) repeat protein